MREAILGDCGENEILRVVENEGCVLRIEVMNQISSLCHRSAAPANLSCNPKRGLYDVSTTHHHLPIASSAELMLVLLMRHRWGVSGNAVNDPHP